MRHDDDLVAAVADRVKARIGLDLRQDGDVGAEIEQPRQHLLRVADRHGDADPLVTRVEERQHLGHVIGADGADAQMADGEIAHRAQEVDRFGLGAEQALGDLEEGSAELAQRHLAATPVQQFDAKIALQGCDLRAERRLADPERLRRRGEAAMGSDGMEGAKL